MSLIRRTRPTDDENPPWAGITFIHPVDSDILSEQLKMIYPNCSTHKQRKHQAAIDFLMKELRDMQSRSSDHPTPTEFSQSQPVTPLTDQHSVNEVASTGSRQHSVSSSNSPCMTTSRPAAVLADRSKESLEQPHSPTRIAPLTVTKSQQIVFSALDGQMMQPKTKRKMTIQERSAYKETRKRGACAKCRQQKGKCTHINDVTTPEESVEDSKKAHKRRKSAVPNKELPTVGIMVKHEDLSTTRHPSSDSLHNSDIVVEPLEHDRELKPSPIVSSPEISWGIRIQTGSSQAYVPPQPFTFPTAGHTTGNLYPFHTDPMELSEAAFPGAAINNHGPPYDNALYPGPPEGSFASNLDGYDPISPWTDATYTEGAFNS